MRNDLTEIDLLIDSKGKICTLCEVGTDTFFLIKFTDSYYLGFHNNVIELVRVLNDEVFDYYGLQWAPTFVWKQEVHILENLESYTMKFVTSIPRIVHDFRYTVIYLHAPAVFTHSIMEFLRIGGYVPFDCDIFTRAKV